MILDEPKFLCCVVTEEFQKFTLFKKNGNNENWSLEPKNEFPEFFVEAKIDVLNMNIDILGSGISNIIEKLPKNTKNSFHSFFEDI